MSGGGPSGALGWGCPSARGGGRSAHALSGLVFPGRRAPSSSAQPQVTLPSPSPPRARVPGGPSGGRQITPEAQNGECAARAGATRSADSLGPGVPVSCGAWPRPGWRVALVPVPWSRGLDWGGSPKSAAQCVTESPLACGPRPLSPAPAGWAGRGSAVEGGRVAAGEWPWARVPGHPWPGRRIRRTAAEHGRVPLWPGPL